MRYKIDCQNCPHSGTYYFPTDSYTRIVKCPACGRGTTAVQIEEKGTLVEKDGMIGVFGQAEEEVKNGNTPRRRRV